MRTAVSCKIPVLLCRDLPPGEENEPQSSPNRIWSIFAPLMIPSPQGPLTKKKGTSNVYLDTQVMGSSPGIRSQSYKESLKSHLGLIRYSSEVGGVTPSREISMAPVCVILSLGLWSSISGPVGRACRACPWAWCLTLCNHLEV